MVFDFAEAKATARRVVHDTLGVQAFYQADAASPSTEIKVRWHGRLIQNGNIDDAGWAEFLEGVDHIVLYSDQAQALGIKSRGIIHIPSAQDAKFSLDSRHPTNGPVTETWTVTRLNP